MSSKKSLEELLEILTNSVDEVVRLPTDIEQFISDKEIESSDTEKVPNGVVYYTYLKWKQRGYGTQHILHREAFFKEFGKFFKSGRHDYRYYRIKTGGFYTSKQEREEILKRLKDEYGKKKET